MSNVHINQRPLDLILLIVLCTATKTGLFHHIYNAFRWNHINLEVNAARTKGTERCRFTSGGWDDGASAGAEKREGLPEGFPAQVQDKVATAVWPTVMETNVLYLNTATQHIHPWAKCYRRGWITHTKLQICQIWESATVVQRKFPLHCINTLLCSVFRLFKRYKVKPVSFLTQAEPEAQQQTLRAATLCVFTLLLSVW